MIGGRIKLIRLADKVNWQAVDEYVQDDLASASEDDKKISKAIKRAEVNKNKASRGKP